MLIIERRMYTKEKRMENMGEYLSILCQGLTNIQNIKDNHINDTAK
jgi:hypothetical protein